MKLNIFNILLCFAPVQFASAEPRDRAHPTPTPAPPTPGGNYHPSIPSSYTGCAFDPNNPSNSIAIFNNENGIPFINKHNHATLSSDPNISNFPSYHFAPVTGAPAGVFDLISNVDHKYLAVFADGHVGFRYKSSQGQNTVTKEDEKDVEEDRQYGEDAKDAYVTTIWSVDCSGALLAGIIGGPQFQFGMSQDGRNELFAQAAPYNNRKRGLFSFLAGAGSKALRLIKVGILPFGDLLLLLHARTDLGIDQTRCSNPALTPVVKWNAPAQSTNGCGSPPFTYNYPPFAAAKCCDAHDFCFDDCSKTLFGCNKPFSDCLFGSCDTSFPGTDIGSLMKHLGCEVLAASFSFIVESEIGRFFFDSGTNKRCICCQKGQVGCPSGCADLQTDPQNCGTCGNTCPSGKCQNGQCVSGACSSPKVCGTFILGECGGSSSCACYTTSGGTAGCSTDYACAGLADCGSDADCGPGVFCAVNTCCVRNVCIPQTCANPAGKLLRLARRGNGTWVEASTAQPAHWE